jgi:hypothetical protein
MIHYYNRSISNICYSVVRSRVRKTRADMQAPSISFVQPHLKIQEALKAIERKPVSWKLGNVFAPQFESDECQDCDEGEDSDNKMEDADAPMTSTNKRKIDETKSKTYDTKELEKTFQKLAYSTPVMFVAGVEAKKDSDWFLVKEQKLSDLCKDPKRLVDLCVPSPFGNLAKGTTEVDTNVRLAFENQSDVVLTPECLSFLNHFQEYVAGFMFAGLPIQFTLNKLNVYPEGGFFKPHKDTPRDKVVGTMVVEVPCHHSGGNLQLLFGSGSTTVEKSDFDYKQIASQADDPKDSKRYVIAGTIEMIDQAEECAPFASWPAPWISMNGSKIGSTLAIVPNSCDEQFHVVMKKCQSDFSKPMEDVWDGKDREITVSDRKQYEHVDKNVDKFDMDNTYRICVFYGDTVHQILPVTSGNRVTVTFYVVQKEKEEKGEALMGKDFIGAWDSLTDLIKIGECRTQFGFVNARGLNEMSESIVMKLDTFAHSVLTNLSERKRVMDLHTTEEEPIAKKSKTEVPKDPKEEKALPQKEKTKKKKNNIGIGLLLDHEYSRGELQSSGWKGFDAILLKSFEKLKNSSWNMTCVPVIIHHSESWYDDDISSASALQEVYRFTEQDVELLADPAKRKMAKTDKTFVKVPHHNFEFLGHGNWVSLQQRRQDGAGNTGNEAMANEIDNWYFSVALLISSV